MLIKIVNRSTEDGREFFEWDLWDGPADCSDHAHGYATDLVHAFSKVLEWRERIANDYDFLYETNDETPVPGTENTQGSGEAVGD
jgi:hypothetical protein